MVEGTPKRLTQPDTSASAAVVASMFFTGTASSHLVDLSIIVNRYLKPSAEVGRGPTKSTWMWLNLLAGTGIGSVAAGGCLVTLPRWQSWQSLHHLETSA
jgi:hypothetical protein